MNIYRIYYNYNNRECWLFVKADTEQKAREIFKNSMESDTEITIVNQAYEHQIVRNDNTLNFTIDFEKDYVCG